MKLTTDRIKDIESIAATALQDAYGNTLLYEIDVPVDLTRVLSHYGLTLKTVDFNDPALADVAGAYSRKEKTIYIPENESYQRNAFTVAHEIGHFLLHEELEDEVFYRRQADLLRTSDESMKTAETEANWFAASLLMPIDLISKYTRIFPDNSEALSTMFGVSREAMRWRLKYIRNVPLASNENH